MVPLEAPSYAGYEFIANIYFLLESEVYIEKNATKIDSLSYIETEHQIFEKNKKFFFFKFQKVLHRLELGLSSSNFQDRLLFRPTL